MKLKPKDRAMDTISIWASKIAEAAAPDEVDLAPIMG